MPTAHSLIRRTRAACLCATICAPLLCGLDAQTATEVAPAPPARVATTDSSRLTLERIFASNELRASGVPSLRWTRDGKGYTALEPSSASAGGSDLVRYDAESAARTVVVPGERLMPRGSSAPIAIEDYQFSDDGRRVLIFTNAKRVWRQYTRGDYWTFDLASGVLRKLGGANAPSSTLMFAKFSPDGARVAYVRANNLYVEVVASGAITPLTSDGSRTIINGTFDWVYEEELNLRDGFRWSPDGKRIAYWQLDACRCARLSDAEHDGFALFLHGPRTVSKNRHHELRGARRRGERDGGATTWLASARRSARATISRVSNGPPAPMSSCIQQLDRRQTLHVMLGNARTGAVHRCSRRRTARGWTWWTMCAGSGSSGPPLHVA